jgi:hypothetical protein
MSARDTERAAALERRYRRLLRSYPPGHRQVHREEMLGVLLATARPGQRAPGAGQTVNLVACEDFPFSCTRPAGVPSSWPAWRLAPWPSPVARDGAWRSREGGEPAS